MVDSAKRDAGEVVRYLDSMRVAYPYGIPRSVILAGAATAASGLGELQERSGLSSAVTVHFIIVASGESLSDQESALLDSIITKGLAIPLEATSRELAPNARDAALRIEERAASKAAGAIVVLGAATPDGRLEQIGTTSVLYSHTLVAIASEAATKREFWGHLKSIVGGLR